MKLHPEITQYMQDIASGLKPEATPIVKEYYSKLGKRSVKVNNRDSEYYANMSKMRKTYGGGRPPKKDK